MSHASARPGYIFLITVLAVGAIASATAVTLLLLGLAAEQNGQVTAESVQALEYMQTCAERALRSLKDDVSYAGDETVTLDHGYCTIHPIGGDGNTERRLCIEGGGASTVRRLEISINRIFPAIEIDSWRDVAAFSSFCP